MTGAVLTGKHRKTMEETVQGSHSSGHPLRDRWLDIEYRKSKAGISTAVGAFLLYIGALNVTSDSTDAFNARYIDNGKGCLVGTDFDTSARTVDDEVIATALKGQLDDEGAQLVVDVVAHTGAILHFDVAGYDKLVPWPFAGEIELFPGNEFTVSVLQANNCT